MILLLLACTLSRSDLDADGFPAPDDCDDHDHSVFPGAHDAPYDGVDADCDGEDDYDLDGDGVAYTLDCDDRDEVVGGPDTFFRDADGDGYGDVAAPAATCGVAGTVGNGGDCDDSDPSIHPVEGDDSVSTTPGDHGEVCNDDVDQNCNNDADGCDLVGEFSAAEADLRLAQGDEGGRGGRALAFAPDLGGPGVNGFIEGGRPAAVNGEARLVWGDFRGSERNLGGAEFSPDASTGIIESPESAYAVASVADLDGDGDSEAFIGACHAGSDAGAVWLLPGGQEGALGEGDAFAVLYGDGSEQLGSALASGDLDGDGAPDLAIGAWAFSSYGSSPEGITYVFSGGLGSTPSTADAAASLRGEGKGDASGNALANAGDLNGDGADDLVVGVINYDSPTGDKTADVGAVYVLLDPVSGDHSLGDVADRIVGEDSSDDESNYFGVSVAGAGDTNDDGYRDLVVGAFGADRDDRVACGAIYVFTGPDFPASAADATARIYGEGDRNFFGWAVAGGGDVDADGFDDVLGGAYEAAHGEDSLTGRAAFVRGPMSGITDLGDSDGRFYGEHALDRLGISVALGDLDGDGHGDVLLGADAGVVGINNEVGWVNVFFGGRE